MSLTLPKRLFHVPTMSTVMYEDNADDVKEKGYVAISHVWGNQKMFTADELDIVNGVDWMVPLSDSDKIYRLVYAMIDFKKEYCWWDILCIPQDKQDEINVEVPFMGDYYAGADVTLVLSDRDYDISESFVKWCDTLHRLKSKKKFTKDEELYITSNRSELANFSKDQWVKRVWTFQEAIMSKEIILSGANGNFVSLSRISDIVLWMVNMSIGYAFSFIDSVQCLGNLSLIAGMYKENRLDLAHILKESSRRDCYKIHDRFYGVLGILGYKDFTVNYGMDIDDLNRAIIKHAYSKGDVSWVGVGRILGTGFAQPMYKDFRVIGTWKTIELLEYCTSIRGDTLHMSMMDFGTVLCYEKFVCLRREDTCDIMKQIISASKSWGFSNADIISTMSGHPHEKKYISEMANSLDHFISGVPLERMLGTLLPQRFHEFGGSHTYEEFSDMGKHVTQVFNTMFTHISGHSPGCIAMVQGSGKEHLLMVCGDTNTGDKVVVPMLKDGYKRGLGLIVSFNKRKGVCYIPREALLSDLQVVSHEFSL